MEKILHLAQQAENAGFYSLYLLEKFNWSIDPVTPYPVTKNGRFLLYWQYIYGSLEKRTFLAANSEKIYLGTSDLDMLFQDPAILA